MPNWNQNKFTIQHPDPDKLTGIIENFKQGRLFSFLLPYEGMDSKDDNVWYLGNIHNWGIKWDVGGDGISMDNIVLEHTDNSITLLFESPGTSPKIAIQRLTNLGYNIRNIWLNEGGFFGQYENGNFFQAEMSETSLQQQPKLREELIATFGDKWLYLEGEDEQ